MKKTLGCSFGGKWLIEFMAYTHFVQRHLGKNGCRAPKGPKTKGEARLGVKRKKGEICGAAREQKPSRVVEGKPERNRQ